MIDQNWKTTIFSNICEVKTGKRDVNEGSKNGEYPFFTCAKEIHRIDSYEFDNEAVLVAGNGFFNVKYYSGKFNAYQRTYVLDNIKISGKYLYYYTLFNLPNITKDNRGSTIRYIRLKALTDQPIAYPADILDQQKIVDKVEELFSVIESVSSSLDYVKKATTNLGSKLLFDSFNGKLTKDWRNNHKVNESGAELAKKYTQKLIPDEKLPSTWAKVRIGDIFGVYVGSTPSRKEKKYWGGEIPWVSSGEVSFTRIKATKETITQLGYDNTSTKIHPIGTVLLGMIGEGKTRGQVAILDIEATHNQNSAAIRVSETDVIPEFVYYFFQSEYQKTRQIGSGNNQKALNKTRVSEIEIPIPPVEEQRAILDMLETFFSNLTAIKNDLDLSEKIKIQSLKQSILKQAFEGKLV
jgi:type I restriction enzyme S subunit